jgi:hypothetical protein
MVLEVTGLQKNLKKLSTATLLEVKEENIFLTFGI